MSIEINTLMADVPIALADGCKPAIGDKSSVLLELHEDQCWVWDFATGKACGEIYKYDGAMEPRVTQLADIPHFMLVYQYLAEQFAANRGDAVGAFLKHTIDAMETALAVKVGSCVYFAQSGSKVKIGWSRRVAARLADLQIGNPDPIKLIGMVPGGRARESELHRRFAHCRVSGEWFEAKPELLAYIGSAT